MIGSCKWKKNYLNIFVSMYVFGSWTNAFSYLEEEGLKIYTSLKGLATGKIDIPHQKKLNIFFSIFLKTIYIPKAFFVWKIPIFNKIGIFKWHIAFGKCGMSLRHNYFVHPFAFPDDRARLKRNVMMVTRCDPSFPQYLKVFLLIIPIISSSLLSYSRLNKGFNFK